MERDEAPRDVGRQLDALGDLRVLDATSSVAGAVATMLLGDLGADVVRLARLGDLDPAGALAWHRNKTMVSIDSTSPDAQGQIHRLRDLADVIVVDDSAPDPSTIGLDAESASAANPSCVHVRMPAYGHAEPRRDLPADSLLLAAASGLSDLFSATWDRPVVPVARSLAYQQGALGAVAAMAGVVGRDRGSTSTRFAVSGLHAAAALLTVNAVHADGVPLRPTKSAASPLPYYRHYECADGQWLYLGALHQPFFLSALETLDAIDVMVMPGVDGDFSRLGLPDVGPAVAERLGERFRSEPRAHWLERLETAGVPVAPVATRSDWLDSPVVETLHLIERHEHPDHGMIDLPAVTVELSATPGRVRTIPTASGGVDPASAWVEDRLVPAPPAGAVAAPPLSGVAVLDVSTFVAAPLSSTILGWFGADVVKVESPDGDPYRAFTVCWVAVNQGKRAVAIDLKRPEGVAQLRGLVEGSDVVVDNLRPSARSRLGFADLVAAANPAAISTSISAFGDAEPWSAVPGFDPLIQAWSGLMAAQGGSGPPVFSPMPVHDVMASALAAFGTLAALHHRSRAGEAQHVGVSLAATSLMVQLGELVRYDDRPAPAEGGVDWSGPRAGNRLYQCSDAWIAVALSDAAVATFVESAPGADVEPTIALEDWFRSHSAAEAIRTVVARGGAAVAVLPRAGVFSDAWLAANRMLHVVDDDELGPCWVTAPYAAGDGVVAPPRPAPRHGQHNDDLLDDPSSDKHASPNLARPA